MAGRIRESSIAQVRERAQILDVVSEHVSLRSAGGGNYKGLCPFHDEKSPSFNVTPSRGMYHCFGCQAGGNVITFVMELEGLSFTETVERLADRFGITLEYEEGNQPAKSVGPRRSRLVEAHKEAATWFAELLGSAPDAAPGRTFLTERGFDQAAAEKFGVGFSPKGGEDLTARLSGLGFTKEEMVASGLVAEGNRGLYDRFRGRLMWPIRDTSSDVIGFGARRILEDDRIEAKYLNTPETSIYKKSQVLYGIDLARREIGRTSQAVIVEGYTDVMACHLAGVGTAVATCGTAFGSEHSKIIRRLLADHDEFRGEVIFTFDGDEAGQKAALRAFEGDQAFAGQTYVTVEPSGLDPCDLRIKSGDAAVREFIAKRIPLYRFVLENVVAKYDLDRADARVDAMREAARLVRSIRDRSKVDAFSRELAGMLGMDPNEVQREVRRASSRQDSVAVAPTPDGQEALLMLPDPKEPRLALERETLKVALQHPELIAPVFGDLIEADFQHPAYRAVWAAIGEHISAEPGEGWSSQVVDSIDADLAPLVTGLTVEEIPVRGPDERFASQHVYRLRELTAMRQIADIKSRLQRTNPVSEQEEYNKMFAELVTLEKHRRDLRERGTD